LLTSISCQREPEVRHYQQIVRESTAEVITIPDVPDSMLSDFQSKKEEAPAQTPPAMPVATEVEFVWQAPEGWEELLGQGMRLVSFRNTDGKSPIDTSIVRLGGEGGGLSANLIRWMQQIGLTVPPEEELEKFIREQESFTTQGGWPAVLYDLTTFQQGAPADTPAMAAVIVELPDALVFVKMTGSLSAVQANKNQLKVLSQSLEHKNKRL
jgi:hypothetical protein